MCLFCIVSVEFPGPRRVIVHNNAYESDANFSTCIVDENISARRNNIVCSCAKVMVTATQLEHIGGGFKLRTPDSEYLNSLTSKLSLGNWAPQASTFTIWRASFTQPEEQVEDLRTNWMIGKLHFLILEGTEGMKAVVYSPGLKD